jgi:hypothetical protein
MPATTIRGVQILNGSVQRADMNTATSGQAVVTKIVQGSNITISSSGIDPGTGDVTVSATVPITALLIVGATAPDASVPNGIVVPRYAAHPDAIWAYGTYDDHFDGASLNAKWTQTIGSGGSISVSNSHVHLYANNATTYISQPVPSAQSFTVSYKSRYAGFIGLVTGNLFGQSLRLFAGTYASASTGIAIQKYYQLNTTFNASSNTEQLVLAGAAAFNTTLGQAVSCGETAPYWRMVFNYSTRSTGVYFSFDGLTWILFNNYTGAQTGFSTTPPTTMVVDAFCTSQGYGITFMDWFKLTTP